MCLAIPMRVVEILESNEAIVEISGTRIRVRTDFIEDVRKGDYLIVHTGIAIQKLDKSEAESILDVWRREI